MGLKEQLSEDLREAMRASDALRRDTLRSLLTAIANAEIARVNVKQADASRQDLPEADVIDVVARQAKQRRESIAEYRKGGREDLASREEAELAIIERYLPEQMSREEVVEVIRAVIAETGATSMKDKGKVMPAAMARLKGRTDGRVVNEVVGELLGSA